MLKTVHFRHFGDKKGVLTNKFLVTHRLSAVRTCNTNLKGLLLWQNYIITYTS